MGYTGKVFENIRAREEKARQAEERAEKEAFNKEMEERVKSFKEINEKRKEKLGDISTTIEEANHLEIDEYKRNVVTREKKNNEKRKIKNSPKKFNKVKMYVVAGILVVSGLVGCQQFKERNAEYVLETVKNELGADEIYKTTRQLSSSSDRIEFLAIKDGEKYRYVVDIHDGLEPYVRINELDESTIEAIDKAATAKASLPNAILSRRYAKRIESGEIKLPSIRTIYEPER